MELSPLHLILILIIALLILGPGTLPDVGASLGKSIREFRKASSDIQESVTVKVDTSPLPPAAPSAAMPTAPEAPSAPSTTPDPQARIVELERQLAESRARGSDQAPPMPAGSGSGDSGTTASS